MLLECTYVYMRMRGPAVVWFTLCMYITVWCVCVCVHVCGVCGVCVCACACLCMYGAHHLSFDGPLQVLNSKRLLKDALIGSFKVQFLVMPAFTIC